MSPCGPSGQPEQKGASLPRRATPAKLRSLTKALGLLDIEPCFCLSLDPMMACQLRTYKKSPKALSVAIPQEGKCLLGR